jgi:MFS family permease
MLVFPSLALSLKAAFDLPLQQVLALSFWMYLLYGLAALPAGIITDLVNSRLMLALCLIGMGLGALAASQSRDVNELRWALAVLGLCAAIYHPAGMALISRGIRRRGRALGTNGVFGNLGVVCAPFLTGVLAAAWGWRAAYLVLAVPCLLVGMLACVARLEVSTAAGAPSRSVHGARKRALHFSLLCGAMMLGGIAYRGQTLILPAYFAEKIGFLLPTIERWRWLPAVGSASVAATALTSLAYLAGAWGQAIGGQLADRHDLRKMYLLFHGLSLPLLLAMGYLADGLLLICAVGYAFFAFGMQPLENSLVAVLTPARLRSTAYGIKFTLTFGVGALAVRFVGTWQREGGLAAVFPRLALCLVLLLCFAALLWYATRREPMTSQSGEISPADDAAAVGGAGEMRPHVEFRPE